MAERLAKKLEKKLKLESSSSSSSSSDEEKQIIEFKEKKEKHEKKDKKEKKHKKDRKEKKHHKKRESSSESSSSSSSDSDSDRDCKAARGKCYRQLKHKLIKDCELMIKGSDAFAYISNSVDQFVAIGAPVQWSVCINNYNINLTPDKASIQVCRDGVYTFTVDVITNQASQFSMFVNNLLVDTATTGTNSGGAEISFSFIMPLYAGDLLQLQNYKSAIGTVEIPFIVGGLEPSQNVQMVIHKIAPIPEGWKCKYPRKN